MADYTLSNDYSDMDFCRHEDGVYWLAGRAFCVECDEETPWSKRGNFESEYA